MRGEIVLKDRILNDIACKYGTPIYVYNGEKLIQQYAKLKSSLPENFEIFYSAKANPLLGICQILMRSGCGIEVSSAGELYVALLAGFKPNNIIFTGPGKTLEELEYAIENDIYSINIESLAEMEEIDRIASRYNKSVNVTIRVNPDFDVSGARIKMTGISSQFGIDQKQLDEVLAKAGTLENIHIAGAHIYSGTQILESDGILSNIKRIMEFAVGFMKRYQINIRALDLGGGFGVPYFNGESQFEIDGFREGMSEIWAQFKPKLEKTRIIVESGRYLTAESGEYLTRILYKKECKDNKYIICDGGSNQHAASAFLGRHIRDNFPMRILGKAGEQELVNIVGPLCTSTDVLGQKVLMSKSVPGDILVIENSGAYGFTHSPFYFLSHPAPAEILYYNGECFILRERGKREDFLVGQKGIG